MSGRASRAPTGTAAEISRNRLSSRVCWLEALPQSFQGVVIANEVLDALPTHVVRWGDDGVFERGVTWRSDSLAWDDRLLNSGPLLERARQLTPPPGYIKRNQPGRPGTRALARRDVGARCIDLHRLRLRAEREYYHPQRDRGTLMCHYRHHVHDDLFFLPGLQDISSHVDFTAVAQAGVESGLRLQGTRRRRTSSSISGSRGCSKARPPNTQRRMRHSPPRPTSC